MQELLLVIIAGLTLGSLHALDADHISAVSVFVSRNPQPRKAMMFGIRWAMGHTTTLFIFGLLSIGLKLVITPSVQAMAEIAVGLILIVLGGWAIRGVFRSERIHIHRHAHDGVEHMHFHSHAERYDHHHTHSMFLVGAMHGFAGTASVLVIIPIAFVSSLLTASLYILLFGIGTMVAMAFFSYILGNIIQAVKLKGAVLWIQGIAGAVSLCIGCVWILERL